MHVCATGLWRRPCRTQITRPDPPLTTVRTAYPAKPFLSVLYPPIKLAGSEPRGYVHLDRWIDWTAVSFAVLVRIKLH